MKEHQKTISKSNEEENESHKIEGKITEMLNEVMEENDSLNSFDFEDDDFEEDFKISRISTRHQTSNAPNSNSNKINQKFNLSNFNRGNKRNFTDILKNQDSFHSSFNTTFLSSNYPEIRNPSFYAQNICGNNIFRQNFLQNISNDNSFGLNNNLNQSFQSIESFNPQNINNNINNCINNTNNNPNFIRNSQPYSKTVIYNNQKNYFKFFQPIVNCNQSVNKNLFNGNNNVFIPLNVESKFQRSEKKKRTYDIQTAQKNNIYNCLNNNNVFNQKVEDQLLYMNNKNIKNKNKCNIINNCIKDSFLFGLKSLLEKTGKIDYHIYELVKGKFVLIIKNHKGSKLFQKYLKSNTSEEIVHLLYIELSQNLEEIITDPYANYFCKKFYVNLSQEDRIDFLNKIKNSIIKYSCDGIGTYSIQTIIENSNSQNEKIIIISLIKDYIEELIYDPYGCHVIEKLLDCFEEEYIPFLYSYLIDNFLKLAYSKNGICIIKKILTFTNKQNMINKIKKIIIENSNDLIIHPYGNFVIQVIIENWNDYKDIINLYKNKLFDLSLGKYSSNVIEKFIEKNDEILKEYIDEIIKSNKIYEVMKSKYGNYVIQKAIKLSSNEYKNKLVFDAAEKINNLIDIKLIQKWKSILLPHIKELTHEQIQELKEKNYFWQ